MGLMPRGPRHRRDDHAVTLAADPERFGLEVRERRAHVERPPTPATVAEVIARAAPPAVRATIELAGDRADRYHQRPAVAQLDVLNDSSLKTEQLVPYASSEHAVTALCCGSATVRSRNRKSATACVSPARRSGAPSAPTSPAHSAAGGGCQAAPAPAASSTNVSRPPTATAALLDQTTTTALPSDHVHLTHGTCRGAAFECVWQLI